MSYRIPHISRNAWLYERRRDQQRIRPVAKPTEPCASSVIRNARAWAVAPIGTLRQHQWEMHAVLKLMCEEI